MKFWVIIPAYNEAKKLEKILIELKKRNFQVMVVDDGSGDETFNIASKFSDVVIRNKKNFGKGVALKEGINYLLRNYNFDYLLTMDGDGQHSCEDLEKFVDEATKEENFVIGNRMQNPINMSKIRWLTNKLMSWFISKLVKQNIPDTQCGFRLIKRELLEKININTQRFEVESELVIKVAKLGYFIKSIPIKTIYFKGKKSKIRPFKDSLRFIKFIFNLERGKI